MMRKLFEKALRMIPNNRIVQYIIDANMIK
nr:MAG TPA: hypothetical protein [Caudoviricetes sp.]